MQEAHSGVTGTMEATMTGEQSIMKYGTKLNHHTLIGKLLSQLNLPPNRNTCAGVVTQLNRKCKFEIQHVQ